MPCDKRSLLSSMPKSKKPWLDEEEMPKWKLEMYQMLKRVPDIPEKFDVLHRIGAGTFSTVYLAHYKPTGREYALKHILPTSHPTRIENELRCLHKIGGHGNVIKVVACFRHLDHVVIVMPYLPHAQFQDYFTSMSIEDIRFYMENLLKALQQVHSYNIIHRDVKPSNFLYHKEKRCFSLVDFGLAQETSMKKPNSSTKPEVNKEKKSCSCKVDGEKKSCSCEVDEKKKKCSCDGRSQVCYCCLSRPQQNASRAGTPGFRAPEVLLKYKQQGTALDIWSAGVIMLSLLSHVYPFFKALDDVSALAQINALFGTDKLTKAAQRLGKNVMISPAMEGRTLKSVCQQLEPCLQSVDSSGQDICNQTKTCGAAEDAYCFSCSVPDSAYDLLECLMTLNPSERITASTALQHPFIQNNLNLI